MPKKPKINKFKTGGFVNHDELIMGTRPSCNDSGACNDGDTANSCVYPYIINCTDSTACNYDDEADIGCESKTLWLKLHEGVNFISIPLIIQDPIILTGADQGDLNPAQQIFNNLAYTHGHIEIFGGYKPDYTTDPINWWTEVTSFNFQNYWDDENFENVWEGIPPDIANDPNFDSSIVSELTEIDPLEGYYVLIHTWFGGYTWIEPEYYDDTSPYWGEAIPDPLTGWVQNSDLVQPDMEWSFMKFEGIPLGNPTYTINSTDGWAAASGAWNWQNTKTKMISYPGIRENEILPIKQAFTNCTAGTESDCTNNTIGK